MACHLPRSSRGPVGQRAWPRAAVVGTQLPASCTPTLPVNEPPLFLPLFADSKHVITACDDMHAHMYDAEHGELVEAFSGGLGQGLQRSSCRQAGKGRAGQAAASGCPVRPTTALHTSPRRCLLPAACCPWTLSACLQVTSRGF